MVSASEVTFDCIVASEVIEHVADIESFIFNISLLVKVSTLEHKLLSILMVLLLFRQEVQLCFLQ